jgi:hypothetical protein
MFRQARFSFNDQMDRYQFNSLKTTVHSYEHYSGRQCEIGSFQAARDFRAHSITPSPKQARGSDLQPRHYPRNAAPSTLEPV